LAASYPTSVKAFSTRNTGDAINASHVNDLQDEVTAIENALINGIAHNVSITGTLATTGLISSTAFGIHTFLSSGTGNQAIGVRNSTAGTGNAAGFRAGTDGAVNAMELFATSSTYTAAGAYPQNGVILNATQAGGLSLSAEHANGDIRLYVGGTLRTQLTDAGLLEHNAAFALSGILSPAALAANTDNWAPASFATSTWIRISSDAARNLTGIAGGASGRMIYLSNQGAFTITLKHETTSTATNRLQCPGAVDFSLTAGTSVMLYYDSVATRWYVVG
jgi:hypothetical protein